MLRQFKGHTARKRKHSCKRLVAGILVLLLILITMPSVIAVGEDTAIPALDIPETLTAEQLALHGAVERLRGEEDEYTFVFLNEDGTRTSYTYGVPVKFEQNGEYIDKNNTIKDFNNEYGNTASDVEIRFPKHLNKISIKYNNHNIKITPVTSVSPGHINASVSGNTVTYYGAFGMGMDLRYASTMSGIKEDIILQSYQGVNSFSFEIETGGLEVKEQNGQYVIADGDEVIFSFGDLEVLDSFTGQNEQTDNWDEHRTYASGSVETVKANQRYVFTVTVDEDFLTNENTVYPVYIDPSFNVTSTYIEDTYICEGSPNTSYITNARMKVGYGSSSQRNRMLIQFSNFVNGESRPGLDYTTVNSAVFHLNCVTTYTSAAYVDAYMIPITANSWSVNTNATWNNQYSNTSSQAHLNGSAVVNGSGWFSFDITDAYRTWWQLFQHRGLMLRMRNEGSSPNYYREFASANNSDSTKLPYLTVHYGAETSGIQFSTSEYYMEIGQTRQLVPLTDLGQNDLAWSSDATSVATVSASGVVTAKAPGIAAITVSSKYEPNKQATCYITVVQVPTTGVTVNRTTEYIALGSQLTASATVTPSNATVHEVTWSTSNSSVAVVTQNGVVMTVGAGTATITARSKFNLRVYDSFQVNVYSTAVTGVTLDHSDYAIKIGASFTLTSQVQPINATFQNVEWFSSNTSVATVSNGVVTACGLGETEITAITAHGNKIAKCNVYVHNYTDNYLSILVEVFDFSVSDSLLIRRLYDVISIKYGAELPTQRAWKTARLLSSFSYSGLPWSEVAGDVVEEENKYSYFLNTLEFTASEFDQLRNAIQDQNKRANRTNLIPDFAHMQYSLAARLAYILNCEGIVATIGSYCFEEDVSFLAGWLGDAVLKEPNEQVSFKNDDYCSDLDAENIFRYIQQGTNDIIAIDMYYSSLAETNTRANIFLNHIDYETVQQKIFYIVLDMEIAALISFATQNGDFVSANYYISLLENEEYHMNYLRDNYYDTYNFLRSLQDELPEMGIY